MGGTGIVCALLGGTQGRAGCRDRGGSNGLSTHPGCPTSRSVSQSAAAFGFGFNFQDDQTHSQEGESLRPLPGKQEPGNSPLEMPKTALPSPILGAQHPQPPTSSWAPQDPPTFFARMTLEEAEAVLGQCSSQLLPCTQKCHPCPLQQGLAVLLHPLQAPRGDGPILGPPGCGCCWPQEGPLPPPKLLGRERWGGKGQLDISPVPQGAGGQQDRVGAAGGHNVCALGPPSLPFPKVAFPKGPGERSRC